MKYLGINLREHLWTCTLKITKPFEKSKDDLNNREIYSIYGLNIVNMSILTK